MGIGASLGLLVVLVVVPILGVEVFGGTWFFAVVVPYLALGIFLAGIGYRVVKWAQAPVPFRIPTTCGQQRSLSWIPAARVDNPSTGWGVLVRVLLEVLLFRSLYRNTKVDLWPGPRLSYRWEKWLWLGALAFHWSFFIIFVRHLRLFTTPVPTLVQWLDGLDGFLRVGAQALYVTDLLFLVAVSYLFLRRLVIPQIRYISLPGDYFPLLLLLGIASTGVLLRYFFRVDVTAVKELALGLVTFHPQVPAGVGILFYLHLFLVSVLVAYFPFSKMVHMAGVFLSPTRNLANNSRARRHINPWNYPVKVHTYAEYEEEFGSKMREAGIPLDG